MIAVTLCILALADASFSGFRAHAGRDGRIDKRAAKANAAAIGAAAGAGTLIALGALILGSIGIGLTTYDGLVDAGGRMLLAYVIYATVVACGFAGYFSRWLEVRSLATMLVLGPGTFARPAVILAGAVAAATGGSASVGLLAFIAAAAMLLIEPALWLWFDRRQESTMIPFAPAPRRFPHRRH